MGVDRTSRRSIDCRIDGRIFRWGFVASEFPRDGLAAEGGDGGGQTTSTKHSDLHFAAPFPEKSAW